MNNYRERLSRVRTAMTALGYGVLILTPGSGMRYLAGFSEAGSRFLALIVTQDHAPVFIVPSLNAGQASSNPAEIIDIRAWDDADGWEPHMQALGDLLTAGSTIGLDDEMPARFVLALQSLLPSATFAPVGAVMAPLRAIKDGMELAAMLRAAAATDTLIPVAYAACRIGATERSVSQAIQSRITETGDELSFMPIVGAGPNGASPHHNTGSTQIKSGDVVVLDFGAMVDEYHGDITRTVAVGHASDEARRVYDIVLKAQSAGVVAVQPGARAQDVDAAARRVIEDAGYGEFFIHRTGHGIGLDDHEPPFMLAGNTTLLLPGHCFSVEPGIYLAGSFGVRLEVIVSVGDDGFAKVLNQPNEPELLVL